MKNNVKVFSEVRNFCYEAITMITLIPIETFIKDALFVLLSLFRVEYHNVCMSNWIYY